MALTQLFCAFLNSLPEIDQRAMETLVLSKTVCNNALGNHPTVQVQQMNKSVPPAVGILGIINGFCLEMEGETVIFATFENGRLARFETKPLE